MRRQKRKTLIKSVQCACGSHHAIKAFENLQQRTGRFTVRTKKGMQAKEAREKNKCASAHIEIKQLAMKAECGFAQLHD